MEGESNEITQQKKKKNREVPDILKEAVMIYFNNLNFFIFTFLISLPFFCFMVYFEFCLQEALIETSNIVSPRHDYFGFGFGYYYSTTDYIIGRLLNKSYFLKLIQLGFFYSVPLYVLELCSAIVTIDLASKLRSEEKNMTLKDMLQKPLDLSNFRGMFITSVYVQFLTCSPQVGLLFIVMNYHVFLKDLSWYVLFAVICSLVFARILRMYLEWSATWNMSLVISILEGIYGIDALALSVYFSRGCHRRGLFLMLIFFAWGHFLRLACLHLGGYGALNGIVIQVALFCLVNPLKWVVCMIYFQDCKERSLEKKTDEELGKVVGGGS